MIDNKTNEQVKSNKTAEKNTWFKRFLAFDLLILSISIIVPYFLINLNHIILTCFNYTNHEGVYYRYGGEHSGLARSLGLFLR